jgi:hypothetical protein
LIKKKFYAIRNLHEGGYITRDYIVFNDIMEKFKGKHLIGKGFRTEEEAKDFLLVTEYSAYTDCSYDKTSQKCSYGYKIYNNRDELKYEFNKVEIDNTGLENVYGELKAVMSAIEMGMQLGDKIEIYFDFSGIRNFPLNAKKMPDRRYAPFIVSYIEFMNEHNDYYVLKNVNIYRANRIVHNEVHNMVREGLKGESRT